MIRPKLVGKYLNLQDLRKVHNIIVSERLYFSNPEEFNDPFEMNPALYRPKLFQRVTPKPKVIISPEILKKEYEKFWHEQQKRMRKFGVTCFSENLKDIIMWSHYADNHKGVCLVFSTDLKFFSSLKKVTYIPERPPMPLLEKKNPGRLPEIMTSKLVRWSDEEEWRLFKRYHNRNYKYPKSALKAVIFGCRCSETDKDLISRMIQHKKIKLYDAILSQYEFKMELNEIQP